MAMKKKHEVTSPNNQYLLTLFSAWTNMRLLYTNHFILSISCVILCPLIYYILIKAAKKYTALRE
jgi:hypothetical protein